MKPPRFDYICPTSMQEVLEILLADGDNVKLIAGGQSLMPALNFRLNSPSALIDLAGIAELQQIRDDGVAWVVGAMVTHRTMQTDARVRAHLPLLSHAMQHVAHVQIRNRGTIGGSVCHADPSAEWPALCVACEAAMVVLGPLGRRRVAAADFFESMFVTAVGPQDVLVEIHFPHWPQGRRWGFSEVSRRTGDFAIAGAAATGDFDGKGVCTRLTLAVFGATDKPERIDVAGLVDQAAVTRDQLAAEADRIARRLEVRGDQHASEAYRSDIVRHVVATALAQIFLQDTR